MIAMSSNHEVRRCCAFGLAMAIWFGVGLATGTGEEAAPQPPTLPEGNQGIASKYPGDRGIGKDPAVLFHDDFEAGHPRRHWTRMYHLENIRIASEPENVHGGARAVELSVPKGPDEVSNELIKELKPAQDVVFLRYYSKFDKGFDQTGSSHNGGYLAALAPKVPFATPGIKADGRNKFIVSFENWRDDAKTPSPGHQNVYIYHPEQRSEWGDHFFPSGMVLPFSSRPGNFGTSFVPRPEVLPELDRWYCYEMMMQANTPGQRDGRIACWVDGKMIADFTNLRLRDVADLKINWAAVDLHIKSSPIRQNKKYYDDVVIATSYIGPVKNE